MRPPTPALTVSCLLFAIALTAPAAAQPAPDPDTLLTVRVGPLGDPEDVALPLRLLGLLTVLSVAPSILMMTTSFVRFIIVFHFVRQALGTQTMPPNQILIGLALFLTLFVMAPTGQQIYDEAYTPYVERELTFGEALDRAVGPIRGFMLHNTREDAIELFIQLTDTPRPGGPDELPMSLLLPAYVVSELKTAFQIGFLLFIPFLVVDMLVSSVLLSMGMMMLPPMMVSLPFKILLFVMVDGWQLLCGSLVRSVFA